MVTTVSGYHGYRGVWLPWLPWTTSYNKVLTALCYCLLFVNCFNISPVLLDGNVPWRPPTVGVTCHRVAMVTCVADPPVSMLLRLYFPSLFSVSVSPALVYCVVATSSYYRLPLLIFTLSAYQICWPVVGWLLARDSELCPPLVALTTCLVAWVTMHWCSYYAM